jgi:hypothetical protein
VDFSFEWGGGGVVSTLKDLHTFTRALMGGKLFKRADTLDHMLAVPEGIKGISYASGLIVFPTDKGPVMYMMGSNGTWVDYYPPLDLVMVGTVDDFSNIPGQFRLRGRIYQILANQGLVTPMARLFSLPMLLVMSFLLCHLILAVIWLIAALFQRRKKVTVVSLVKWAHRLTVVAVVANLVMMAYIGMTFGQNIFQMLFGFSTEVRHLFAITAFLIGLLALAMATFSVQLWRRKEVRPFDRKILTAMVAFTLAYAISMGVLGL